MKQVGTFPTPYGASVPVFENPVDPETVLFNATGFALCAGIHNPEERRRFEADATAQGRCDINCVDEYGGRRLLHVPLPKPYDAANERVLRQEEIGAVLTSWTNLVMDRPRWCDRARGLLPAIEGNLQRPDDEAFFPILILGLRIILTAALEHLAEPEIDCIEAAAFYALTVHDEWTEAAIKWLEPVASTWWRDWVAERPVYRRFAAMCQDEADLPVWITGDAR